MCFQETFNDLFDVNVSNDKFALLVKLNEVGNVKVKTPCGKSDTFDIHNKIMQGSVFGPLKCAVQVDTLGRDTLIEDYGLYKYKDAVNITPLAMIDDVASISTCGIMSLEINAKINAHIESKKLMFSQDKCRQIHYSRMKTVCHSTLKAHTEVTQKTTDGEYLGDILSNDGTNTKT